MAVAISTAGFFVPMSATAVANAASTGISFVQIDATDAVNNNPAVNATLPSNVADANLLLAVVGANKGTQVNWTEPSGWPAQPDVDVSSGGSSSSMRALVSHRVASNDAGVTYSWSGSPWSRRALAVLEYSGVDTNVPYDAAPTSGARTAVAPGLTTATPGA
ncbi:MAG: hypothetical protein ACRDV3_05565, partial [Acidothermaceae bacterium]